MGLAHIFQILKESFKISFHDCSCFSHNDVRQVKTREVIVDKDEVVKDPIYFIEKQANRGGYGLMLPATETRKRIAELSRSAKGYRHVGEKFEMVGKELAKVQHLPHFRIRARMIQLGNVEAKGSLNYVDHELIEPFAFNTDSWREDQHSYLYAVFLRIGVCCKEACEG